MSNPNAPVPKVIYKQKLRTAGVVEVHKLPWNVKFVGLGFQLDSNFVFWYEQQFNQQADETWELSLVGTGHTYPSTFDYLAGPVMVNEFVFHLVGRKVSP